MKFGLLGFPKVGKTSLFNILTGAQVSVDKFSSGRSGTNVGVAKVIDPRVARLGEIYKPKKLTYAQFDFLDLQGVQKGEGQQSLSLGEMRNVDAIAHVVRAFEDPALPHAEGSIDPARDIATMEMELVLADLEVASKRRERLALNIKKAKNKDDEAELPIVERCLLALEKETPIRALDLKAEDLRRIRGFAFLTAKPLLLLVNVDEGKASRVDHVVEEYGLKEWTGRPHTAVAGLSAKVEEEIARLDPEDARAFLADLGVAEPAKDRVIHAAFGLLGLIQFLTAGEDECRGWSIAKGTRAPQAAGTIHSDIERGFIRAEVVAYEDLVAAGSLAAAREKALLRSEGKDYVVRDGDVINFRFNV
ncbi:MAG TPA: redox-regulated ATPase YchF [Candidatus Polarisedimenticolia bacterium]|nr:redox-regulated ATPase YchF [Candidatus Polarisedimenticolia bacterium]